MGAVKGDIRALYLERECIKLLAENEWNRNNDKRVIPKNLKDIKQSY